MDVQNDTECKNHDTRNGCFYSNYLQSPHLPSFGGQFSAFQNWKDCLKRNGEEFHISLEDLKSQGLWETRRQQAKSEKIPNHAHVNSLKIEKKANRGPNTPTFGQYLPAFAPVFAGLMHRRRRRENRPRRQRTTFSNDQTVKLEIEYNRTEYITRARRYELAEMLCLTENQIKIWFQNRRAKEKRIEKAHLDHHLSEVSDSLTLGDKDKEIRHLLAKMDDMDTRTLLSANRAATFLFQSVLVTVSVKQAGARGRIIHFLSQNPPAPSH